MEKDLGYDWCNHRLFLGVNRRPNMMWSICLISSVQATAAKAKAPAVLVGMLSRCCNWWKLPAVTPLASCGQALKTHLILSHKESNHIIIGIASLYGCRARTALSFQANPSTCQGKCFQCQLRSKVSRDIALNIHWSATFSFDLKDSCAFRCCCHIYQKSGTSSLRYNDKLPHDSEIRWGLLFPF